jgi:DNA invertase Pin-like site-specific DNA recombinase
MNVIGYCRVSTSEQADSGLGIAAQRQRIAAEAARRGWNITFIDDTGSGKDMKREGITRALGMLKAGDAAALVVAKLDRVTRSLSDFVRLMEQGQRERWAMGAWTWGSTRRRPTAKR